MPFSFKPFVIVVITLLFNISVASASSTIESGQVGLRFDIPSQPLEKALIEFSEQSGLALMIAFHNGISLLSPPLSGTMPVLDALKILLAGSPLAFKQIDGKGLVIYLKKTALEKQTVVSQTDVPVEGHTLDEILVTATKRATRLQDTPMAITAINAGVLKDYQITNVFELFSNVPSLKVAPEGDHSMTKLYLRGAGTDNYTEAGDSGIAYHVDGIYNIRSQATVVLFYDLERVEVLRGPQGTLFGRNATAGVINYHTAKPENTLTSRLDITLGNYQRRKVELMTNIPVTKDWAVRLVGVTDQADGTVAFEQGSISKDREERYNNIDLMGYRLSSNWAASDSLNWWLSYEKLIDNGAGYIPLTNYKTPVLIDTLGNVDLHIDTYRSRLDWSVSDNVLLTYIAGFTKIDRSQDWDDDRDSPVGSETNVLAFHQSNRTVWSDHSSRQHELQIKNRDNDSGFRWLAAYFDFEESNGIRFDIEHQDKDGSGWGGAPSHSFLQPNRGSSFRAFYGQLGLDLSDHWSVTAGARTGRDNRYDRGGRNIACPDLINSDRNGVLGVLAVNRDSAVAGQCFVDSYNDVDQSWVSTTYMARLEYRPSEQVLMYLLYAEGFKPGIVQDGRGVSGVFSGWDDPDFQAALANAIVTNNGDNEKTRAYVEPETSKNLEFGFKLSLLGGSMTLNGALFRTRYLDLQVENVVPDEEGTEVIENTNGASATVNGLELELNWATSVHGRLSGHLSLLDPRYDKFTSVDDDFLDHGKTWNPSANSDTPNSLDFSGNQIKHTPKISLSLNYSHRFLLEGYAHITPRLSVHYSDKVYFHEANRKDRNGWLLDNSTGEWIEDPNGAVDNIDMQPSYWKWDMSLKYEPLAASWMLKFYVNNIMNEEIRYNGVSPDAASPEFYLEPPRTMGIHFGARFK